MQGCFLFPLKPVVVLVGKKVSIEQEVLKIGASYLYEHPEYYQIGSGMCGYGT
jgi:hypothetical protein